MFRLAAIIILVASISAYAPATKARWCRAGESPQTHKCDVMGSGSGSNSQNDPPVEDAPHRTQGSGSR